MINYLIISQIKVIGRKFKDSGLVKSLLFLFRWLDQLWNHSYRITLAWPSHFLANVCLFTLFILCYIVTTGYNWISHTWQLFAESFLKCNFFAALILIYVCFALLRKGFGFATLEADGLIVFFYLSFHPRSTLPTVQTQKRQHFECSWGACSGVICVGKNVGWNSQHIYTVMVFSMEGGLVPGQPAFMGISCGCWVAQLNCVGQFGSRDHFCNLLHFRQIAIFPLVH